MCRGPPACRPRRSADPRRPPRDPTAPRPRPPRPGPGSRHRSPAASRRLADRDGRLTRANARCGAGVARGAPRWRRRPRPRRAGGRPPPPFVTEQDPDADGSERAGSPCLAAFRPLGSPPGVTVRPGTTPVVAGAWPMTSRPSGTAPAPSPLSRRPRRDRAAVRAATDRDRPPAATASGTSRGDRVGVRVRSEQRQESGRRGDTGSPGSAIGQAGIALVARPAVPRRPRSRGGGPRSASPHRAARPHGDSVAIPGGSTGMACRHGAGARAGWAHPARRVARRHPAAVAGDTADRRRVATARPRRARGLWSRPVPAPTPWIAGARPAANRPQPREHRGRASPNGRRPALRCGRCRGIPRRAPPVARANAVPDAGPPRDAPGARVERSGEPAPRPLFGARSGPAWTNPDPWPGRRPRSGSFVAGGVPLQLARQAA